MKKIIELTRDDLIDRFYNKPSAKIGLYDFKQSSITLDEIDIAHVITFIENNERFVLKNKRL